MGGLGFGWGGLWEALGRLVLGVYGMGSVGREGGFRGLGVGVGRGLGIIGF